MEKGKDLCYEGEIIDLMESSGNSLYFSTRNGFVYCIDGVKQIILWKHKVSSRIKTPPYLGPKNIYVCDEENILYCLSKEGNLIWKKALDVEITSGIGAYSRNIFLGTAKGDVYALDPDTGERSWSFQAGDAVRTTPILAAKMVIFGCDDHYLYFLSEKGRIIDRFEAGDSIQSPVLADETSIYFSSNDYYFYCLDLKKRKKKWRIKIGGKVLASPISDQKRVFFLCWNTVLYCVNKKNGTILWWNAVPSRSYYDLELTGDKIIAASLSSHLDAFNIKTGKKEGDFEAAGEVRSNPVWFKPFLLVNTYNDQEEQGCLHFLKKVIQVRLVPSKPSPQRPNEEIIFTVSVEGFYRPQYEFYIIEGSNKAVLQEKSEKNSWTWYPEREGIFRIGILVTDEKEKRELDIPFVIQKRDGIENSSLVFCVNCNQEEGQ